MRGEPKLCPPMRRRRVVMRATAPQRSEPSRGRDRAGRSFCGNSALRRLCLLARLAAHPPYQGGGRNRSPLTSGVGEGWHHHPSPPSATLGTSAAELWPGAATLRTARGVCVTPVIRNPKVRRMGVLAALATWAAVAMAGTVASRQPRAALPPSAYLE